MLLLIQIMIRALDWSHSSLHPIPPFTRRSLSHTSCRLSVSDPDWPFGLYLIWLARYPLFASSVYCASKAGLTAFGISLSRELRHQNVFVSVVEPGSYETTMNVRECSHIGQAYETLSEDLKSFYGPDFAAELAVDVKTHAFGTSLDHAPLIDQLVRSAASKCPPDVLVGVTNFAESSSIILVESMPIDLMLKGIRSMARMLRKFGFLASEFGFRSTWTGIRSVNC